MNLKYKLLTTGTVVALAIAPAHAQRFPKLSDLRFPTPATSDNGPSDQQKAVGTGAGCVAGGATGWLAGRAIKRRLGEMSGRDANQVVFLSAGLGCVIGGTAARRIIENMQESAKQAQQEAWTLAQAQTEPVEWEDPNTGYMGTVELAEIEHLPDGKKCGTRRNFVQSPEGEAKNFVRVCENDSGAFVPLEV